MKVIRYSKGFKMQLVREVEAGKTVCCGRAAQIQDQRRADTRDAVGAAVWQRQDMVRSFAWKKLMK